MFSDFFGLTSKKMLYKLSVKKDDAIKIIKASTDLTNSVIFRDYIFGNRNRFFYGVVDEFEFNLRTNYTIFRRINFSVKGEVEDDESGNENQSQVFLKISSSIYIKLILLFFFSFFIFPLVYNLFEARFLEFFLLFFFCFIFFVIVDKTVDYGKNKIVNQLNKMFGSTFQKVKN